MNRIDFNDISPDPELSSVKFNVIALILHKNKSGYDFRPVINIPNGYSKSKFTIILRRTDTVNAAYAADYDYIIP